MMRSASLQARLYLLFQVTNNELRHRGIPCIPFREISSLPPLDGRSRAMTNVLKKLLCGGNARSSPTFRGSFPGADDFVQDPKLNVDAQSKRSLA
jgi:hypothetical protein